MRAAGLVDVLDGLARCQVRLSALAGLMVTCDEMMQGDHVREIGTWIAEEMGRLDELKAILKETTR